MECNIQNIPKKEGYDPQIKKEEYEEWLKVVCNQVANGEEWLLTLFIDGEGSQK